MNTLDELRRTLDGHADIATDDPGLLHRVQAGAVKARRRRRIAQAVAVTAATVVAVAAVPLATSRWHTDGPPTAASAPYRTPGQVTVALADGAGYFALAYGTDATRQFLKARPLDQSGTDSGGTVHVYDPGTFDPARVTSGEPVTVSGHPAFYVANLGGTDNPPRLRQAALGWQDPSGAWVVVTDATERTRLLRLAEAVRLGPPRAITAPVQIGWIPDGLPLSYASGTDSTLPAGIGRSSYLGFAAGREPTPIGQHLRPAHSLDLPLLIMIQSTTSEGWTEMVDPRGTPPGRVPTQDWRTIGGQPGWYIEDSAATGLFSPGPGAHLFVEAGSCGALISVRDKREITEAELERLVAGMTFGSCTDESTWRPVLS